jgi:hypothetical protein
MTQGALFYIKSKFNGRVLDVDDGSTEVIIDDDTTNAKYLFTSCRMVPK